MHATKMNYSTGQQYQLICKPTNYKCFYLTNSQLQRIYDELTQRSEGQIKQNEPKSAQSGKHCWHSHNITFTITETIHNLQSTEISQKLTTVHGRSQGGVLGVLGPPQSSSHNFFIMEEVVYTSTVL